jgi:hypothetical protein
VALLTDKIDSEIDPVRKNCLLVLKKILDDLQEADQYEQNDDEVTQQLCLAQNEIIRLKIGVDQLE